MRHNLLGLPGSPPSRTERGIYEEPTLSEEIRIAHLADHPEAVPTLAEWFRAVWPEYYGPRSEEAVLEELCAGMSRDHLPVRLVAFRNGEPAGTVILREHAISTRPHRQPGLGGLCVTPDHRHRGVGAALVTACAETARALGYPELYAATNTADGIFLRLGWEWLEEVVHHGHVVNLYRCREVE